jgi:hypothetical protein
MTSLVSSAAKLVFPERFKSSLKVEEGVDIGPRRLLNIFEFDIVRRRSIVYKNDITSNPVEDGSVITDNIVKLPIEISYEGLITEASISNSILNGITRFIPVGSDFDRLSLAEAFKVLVDLRENATEVIIEVPYGAIYRGMYVESLEINDDVSTSTTLSFNIQFKQIQKSFTLIEAANQNKAGDNPKSKTSFGDQPAESSNIQADELTLLEFTKRRVKDFNVFE